ncbi:MAG: FHA domain-containing protein [Ardenticatenaceae bacterium]|nr:FHA domain-containing protein [Ardenticatenaceae bacterium]
MAGKIRGLQTVTHLILLILLVGTLVAVTAVYAQTPPPKIFITNTDASSPPTLEIQVYGLTSQGDTLNFATESINLKHNGLPIIGYELAGSQEVGTFTIFLIDIPEGTSAQFTAITEAINEFANEPTMKEQVDAIAVFQVGENSARQLMEPTKFYNSVRNLFATPLTAAPGSTALVDSIGSLLQQIDTLKPDPAMSVHIVVMSDGTDAVSTQFQPEQITQLAADAGVPIHTIWLNNADLSESSHQSGQDYLTSVASATRGLAIKLENTADLSILWMRIVAFRNQTLIRYTLPDLQGGQFPVDINLTSQPDVTATADIIVPTNMPSVLINLPEESRTLTLPSLDDPVRLRFATTITWLDGNPRQVVAAQLVVNGVPQDIPLDTLDEFALDVANLGYGENSIQVAILDEQGMRATSSPISLLINEGARDVPEELSGGGGFFSSLGRILLAALVLAILVAGGYFIYRQGWLANLPAIMPKRRRRSREPQITYEEMDDDGPRVLARLHVLESETRMPVEIGLTQPRLRIGRSPSQADLAFESDLTMSRLHATLMLEGTHYRIFDEGSTSGTWVNEQQVPEYGTQLVDGDEIHLGAVHLRYYQP